ncbi:hypothetical protein [Salsipaludibacter albus]|uniref:hypothetical protein n=1 Tax=Salsipaludibacter albus TaxID=2849650 RepID=UPI001EE42171|nr:hypothetical protein [Salsipaludibacter albus]MBY5164499.1 hypothetical protein [Salsipaludibacter albus]
MTPDDRPDDHSEDTPEDMGDHASQHVADGQGRPAPPARAPRHRYHGFDGQDPFASRLDTREVLDRMSHDLLQGFTGREALQRLLDEGFGDVRGLDEIRRQIAQRRREASETGAGKMLSELGRELDAIVDQERDARNDAGDQLGAMELDLLPPDPAGRMGALSDTEFTSPEAGERFRQLKDQLTRDLLDAQMAQLSAGIASVTPDDLARTRQMLADLNELVAQRERGEEPDLDAFYAEHGDFFPDRPDTLDELLAQLAERMAAMSRLLASLPPEQRRQLMELQRQVLDDPDLQLELLQLEDALRDLMPNLPWDSGDLRGTPADQWDPFADGVGRLSDAVDQAQRLGELEQLEDALGGLHPGATLDDVDPEALRRELGDAAAEDLRRLREVERALEESGAMTRRGGQLELTPRGARLIGQQALTDLLQRVRREPARRSVGADPEPTGGTRPWEFGDREPIATTRTVHNAVLRSAGAGLDGPVRLHPDDIEVVEQEVRPRTATALLLDLSWSMPLQGHLVPAKRMALALHALITGKHRQDSLHLVGFSDYARRLEPADLSATGFERVYGTNMHHAFLLARRILLDDPRPVKQVIMVTDGEPTAHLEQGRSIFNWPPVPATLEATLREATRLARSDISLDVFLLEDAHGLVAFAERLADITGGSVTHLQGEALGRHIVTGYERYHDAW